MKRRKNIQTNKIDKIDSFMFNFVQLYIMIKKKNRVLSYYHYHINVINHIFI